MAEKPDFNFFEQQGSQIQMTNKTKETSQKTQTSENKAQEVKYNANLSFKETKIDFKKTELELEGVVKTSKSHIEKFNKTKEEISSNVPSVEIPRVEEQIEKIIDLNEQKIALIDKYKKKEIKEDEYKLQKYEVDMETIKEINNYDKLMSDIYKNNKNLTKEQKEWFKDQFKQNQKMLGEIYSEIIGVGNGNSEVNLHSERLIQALLAQVQLANEKTKKKQDEIMLEYLDKLAFIKDSIKELSNSKKEDENKFKEVANYYETYNHETTELTNTIKAAQKFVIITNIKNENIRETQIREYGKNTKIKFENGKESTPNQDYLERTLPVRL